MLLAQMPPAAVAASLDPAARATLVVLMVVGILLILQGARLLRPAVVLATMAVGFLGAIVTARALLPGVPLWAAAAAGAVAGLLAGSLLYRPAVALVAAAVGSAVGALVAFAVMSGGALDTAPRDLGHALVENPREVRRQGDGQRAGMRILEVLAPDAVGADAVGTTTAPRGSADAALASAADAALPVGERALRTAVDVTHRAADRATAAYRGTAPAYRTLLTASVAAGAAVGLAAGLLATGLVARILTSFAGAWILLGGTLPLMALRGLEPMPADARTWLIVLATLALAGTLAQGALGSDAPAQGSSKPRRKAPRRADPAPAAAAAAD